jgi:hypothetical protein
MTLRRKEKKIVAVTTIVIKLMDVNGHKVHRSLKFVAFNENDIFAQRSELSKQLEAQRIDVAILSAETHLKPHERFSVRNYHIHRTDCHPGLKGGTAIAVGKGILHTHVAPLPVSIKATEICVSIGNKEILLAAVYKTPGPTWSDADVIWALKLQK